MSSYSLRHLTALALVACLASPTGAEEAKEAEAASREQRAELRARAIARQTEAALAVVRRASDFLAKQKRFAFEAELGYDVVQRTGQSLEFGGSREVLVKRPDRARIEVRSREGDEHTVFFDGRGLSISNPSQNAYARVEKPGTLDEVLDYVVDDLDTPVPLADLLYSRFYDAGLEDRVERGFVVGDSEIADVACQHVALRTDVADVQLWIQQGDEPLVRRIVIGYREEPGTPNFWAWLHDWDLSPRVRDGKFEFEPPKGAERLPILALGADEGEAR